LSRPNKILAGVLVVTLAVLLADRLLVGLGVTAPVQASAAAKDSVEDVEATVVHSLSPPPADKNVLTGKLEMLASRQQVTLADMPDAFKLPERWLAEQAGAAPESQGQIAAEEFAQAHQLKAVMVAGNGNAAVIGGQCVFVGQVLDGFRLISVNEDSVVFRRGQDSVVLKLEGGM